MSKQRHKELKKPKVTQLYQGFSTSLQLTWGRAGERRATGLTVGCLAATLPSTHQMPVAASSLPPFVTTKNMSRLSQMSLGRKGAKSSLVENPCFIEK